MSKRGPQCKQQRLLYSFHKLQRVGLRYTSLCNDNSYYRTTVTTAILYIIFFCYADIFFINSRTISCDIITIMGVVLSEVKKLHIFGEFLDRNFFFVYYKVHEFLCQMNQVPKDYG